MESIRPVAAQQNLPVLPLRGLVVFPHMQVHFDVGRTGSLAALKAAVSSEQKIFLAAQKDMTVDEPKPEDLCNVGTIAEIKQIIKVKEDTFRVLVEGLYRARLLTVLQPEAHMQGTVRRCLERRVTDPIQQKALLRECQTAFREYAQLSQHIPSDMPMRVAGTQNLGWLCDYLAANLDLPVEDKQFILETTAVQSRAQYLLRVLREEADILQLENSIQQRVQESMDQNQRDYYLREQLRVISDELGESDSPLEEAEEYMDRIDKLPIDDDSKKKLNKEAEKLAKMPVGSHEATVVRGYLDTCLDLPFGKKTREHIDLSKAKKQLDKEHYGLQKVKERILETLAVRKLNDDAKGQILCLVGPPGVGKSTIARSVAQAMGRKFARISLGGMRDEADIRGHRKTYIGAMPGRIISAVISAGVQNPVLLLDEIDKVGNDYRGDPSAALLEVLDPEQNCGFVDHFLEIPFDLSDVFFITTANDIDGIPQPLYDRMDVITLSSYTAEEKFEIAKRHLLRRQLHKNGLSSKQVVIPSQVLRMLIAGYTREAGVRTLERTIESLCRKCAKKIVEDPSIKTIRLTPALVEEMLGPKKFKDDVLGEKDEVGVVCGLAWTSVGGETMPVEVAVLDGTGKVELTGSLGDVMKESAVTAISYVRARTERFHIAGDFYKTKDIHIHVPEGAVPKDGPSAGVTMATAMVSALTGIPVRRDVAMTGEITLRGRVLPIGGLKEKTMAAYLHHMKTVIIPKENQPDLFEIDPVVRENLQFVTAESIDTVLENALTRMPGETVHDASASVQQPAPAGC